MAEQFGNKPDCIKCPPDGFIKTLPANFQVMDLINKYMPTMINGMGGINANGIQQVIEWENIPEDEQYQITLKLIIYLMNCLAKKNEVLQDGRRNTTIHNRGRLGRGDKVNKEI